MPSQIEKIAAHSSHLLTAFIQLRERYALLYPMLFVEHVPKQYGSRKQARGFAILKGSLFFSCCQDIAKLTTDDHDNTPSIKKLMERLSHESLREQFRNQHAYNRGTFLDDENDPVLANAYRRMAQQDALQAGVEFDRDYEKATQLWAALAASPILKDFRIIRDKITAHTEIKLHNDEYKLVDTSTLGITWGDLKKTIDEMQQLVELIGRLTRDASFAWESLDNMLERAGNDFWLDQSSNVGALP